MARDAPFVGRGLSRRASPLRLRASPLRHCLNSPEKKCVRPGPQPTQNAREQEEWERDGAYFFLMLPALEDDEEEEERELELWEGAE